MTRLRALRTILRKRKYLVLWQASFHPPFEIGHIVTRIGGEGFDMGTFKVRCATSQTDFLAQQSLCKTLVPEHLKHGSPTAMLKENRTKFGPLKFWRVTPTKARIKA